ncbi:hypothetical protein HOLleu_01784 [Holothuria leucospilota]|uniref:Farnesoic acid O-methyl transferase domain-containing protein n=1 Tax=Holothuria leucospilota TaxID=206669 RepID=A0A9Q1CPT0_HOLLE|nr:hypothetical protein HOLleu_01784 [Holothuria leucospilota]
MLIKELCPVTDLGHYGLDIEYEVPSGSDNVTEVHKPAGTIAHWYCRKRGFANVTKKCERGLWKGEELECLRNSCKLYSSLVLFNESGFLFFDIPHGATEIDFKLKGDESAKIVLSPTTSENGSYVIYFRRKSNTQYTVLLCWKTCTSAYDKCWSCFDLASIKIADTSFNPEKFLPFWVKFKNSRIEVGIDNADTSYMDPVLDYPHTSFNYFGYPQDSSANIHFCKLGEHFFHRHSRHYRQPQWYRQLILPAKVRHQLKVSREKRRVQYGFSMITVIAPYGRLFNRDINSRRNDCVQSQQQSSSVGRSEQTIELGSVNEGRAENNSSPYQLETNLCTASNKTNDEDKNTVMMDNIVYESAADTPTASEEAQSKPSIKKTDITGETVFYVARESHRKSSGDTKMNTTKERDPVYEYID